ncbi:MAG: tetratricopeptide repeat protein, partial [Verrucomicrobia bacterium]|nr:tetratricopeptide repeat protein [Verrucomicrobiota bacterium]
QRDLFISWSKISDVPVAQGDLTKACQAYEQVLAVNQRLAASDPANAAWQRDLSVSLNKLGDLAVAQGDLAGALRYFTQDMAIAERLAASDPANAAWQRDLAVSHFKLYQFAQKQGDEAMQQAKLRACFLVLDSMKQRGMHLDPQSAQVYAQLAGMQRREEGSLPLVQSMRAAAPPAPAPKPDPIPAALALLAAGRGAEAIQALRPLVFPNDSVEMDHRTPLEARLGFVRAFWVTQNQDGVKHYLPRLPEQDDPGVQAICAKLAEWEKGLSWAQKTGFCKKPQLPPLDTL